MTVLRELDRLLTQVLADVEDGVAANQRLADLLRANQLIIGDLLMPIVLRRIAEAAGEVTGSSGCVLTLRDHGGEVTEVVGYGVDAAELASMRLLAADATQLVPGYAATPISRPGRVFGTIYLARSGAAAGFELSSTEAALMAALARTAAVAIDNAELFDESRHRQHWLQASTEIFRQLLSGSADEHLGLITSRARDIADADAVTLAVGRSDGASLEVRVTAGRAAEGLVGWVIPLEGSLSGRVVASGEPVRLADFGRVRHLRVPLDNPPDEPAGPALILPLIGSGEVRGVLSLVRLGGRPSFTPVDLELAAAFASQATLALDLSEARLHQQRMMLLEDRDRIARDLHDHVIQRLFAAGLSVEGIARSLRGTPQDTAAERLVSEVGEIDAIIRELRSSILRLRGSLAVGEDVLRARLREVTGDARSIFGFTPTLRIVGTVERRVGELLVGDLTAMLGETFADIARRGGAKDVPVAVTVARGWLTVTVADNAAPDPVPDGVVEALAQVRRLARSRGGTCEVSATDDVLSPAEPGRTLTWSVPTEPAGLRSR